MAPSGRIARDPIDGRHGGADAAKTKIDGGAAKIK